MIKKIHILAFILGCNLFFAQTTYYVDQQNGSDSNNGTSIATAFETFDEAENQVSPGDTIEIVGEYTNSSYNPSYSYSVEHDSHLWHAENTIRINNLNGSAGNYITIKAHDENTVLRGDGANIFRVTNSSYLRIEDFNIEGEVERIPLSTANALQFVYITDNGSLQGTVTNPLASDIRFRNEDETNDNDNIVEETDIYTDISNENVKRPSYIDTRGFFMSNSEHIIITNNTIHHTPGGGLRVSDSKYVDILENEIYRCSVKSYSGTHALVVTKTEPIGSSDYSIKILRNEIHHNYNEQYSWSPSKTIITPRIDEGKGISLQRNNTNGWINGNGRILVANNLCYWNGFSGVHTNDGHRIDFINNTCYMNSYTNTITYPETNPTIEQRGNNIGISAQSSNDIKMINNISVIDTDWNAFALSAGGTTNLTVTDNMIFGINGTVNQDNDVTNVDENTTIANPLFVNVGDHLLETIHNFNLQSNSPAIDIADDNFAPNDDFNGNTRDSNPDLGALEFDATLSNQKFDSGQIKLYPNPTKSDLFLSFNNLNIEETFEIYNILGKRLKVINANTQGTLKIDVSSLASGLYIIKNKSSSIKFIKE
ncbi:hypothetical protein BWZ20_07910 [Winogradskyella sp. J14-2]|uniref:T9SS type A sorting domain-containing protein n=1 Tax=Winogradskyella sp. J14-2 TaxID=1936080 RepID=UPI000972CA11|nr:T9SS type A sorting domain-containing protein [Winogradskyella sp. J14-2]APY08230.1 hypothetical protein BWZ20_07910 [Winogradskyella sp. J14-2]